MNKKFLIIVIFAVIFLSISAFGANAQSLRNCTNYANYSSNAATNRTWIIANSTLCLGPMKVENISNITIRTGGTLHLQDINISFNGSITETLGVAVESGGTLKIDNGSTIFSANGTALGYSFYYYGGSSGFINNSSISGLQNFTGSNGINIQTSSFEFSNSTINNSLGYAFNISSGSPTIKNSTFFNNPAGILVWNSSPTITNISIKLTADTTTDAGLNITNSNGASITNVTLSNQTFGIVLTNSNLTFLNISIDNSTFGVFPKSNSRAIFVDSSFTNARSMGSTGFPNASLFYFNVSSNNSNVTLVNPSWTNTNITFYGDNTANLTEKWYVDVYVRSNNSNSSFVQGATVVINSTANLSTELRTYTTNSSGTFPRINLTSFIVYYNATMGTNVTANYSNYWFNATKGNATTANTSVIVTNNGLFLNRNVTINLTLSTVTISVKGSGAAAGYTVQNALVSLTNGSFNLTANTSAAGIATIDVPFGVYTINVSSGNYTQLANASYPSSNYTVNVSECSSSSCAINFTMLPRINLTGNNSGSFWSNANQNVTSGTAITIAGTASYAHNGTALGGCSQCGNASFYISSATSYLHSIGYSNISISGAFSKTLTPTESSSIRRTADIWILDSHGANGTNSTHLDVYVAAGANVTDGGGGGTGGGGGGEGAGNYQLVITEYDRKLTMAQGETKLVKVTVKNTGLRALEDVGLIIASKNNEISSTWYRINVSTTGLATEDLSSGETVVYNVRIILPSSALSKTYAGTWRAKDKDSLAIAERGMNLTITQVWTTTTIAALNNSLTSLEKIFADLEKNFTLIKGSVANVSQFETTLKSINGTIKQSRASFDSGAYDDAKSKADQVSTDISKFVADIEVARSINPAAVIIAAFTSLIGIVILVGVAVAASLGGFFIWWMFFRIISIGEVKRNPAKFAGGVRLAGAVKSITDTKKGKVFLIADTSGERLHVRYPYYTTTEVGDLIKVGGVVKIYKDIPYMDATELSRVTMKPTTTK